MYDLAVSNSDTDYTIVFVNPTAAVCGVHPPPSHLASTVPTFQQDKHDVIEYGAIEAGEFVNELLKGNPKTLEPLFLDSSTNNCLLYESPLWLKLKQHRKV